MVALAASPSATASALRRLHFARFGFAVVWAALMVAAGPGLGAPTVALLVLYPLVDVTAAIADVRSSRLMYATVAISSLAAVGVGVAAASGVPAVVRVWGVWAVVAGLVQLIVASTRRGLGGRWAMILSGGISVLAGTGFVLMAGADDAKLTTVAGYAVAGGVFFLISALRLGRAARPR